MSSSRLCLLRSRVSLVTRTLLLTATCLVLAGISSLPSSAQDDALPGTALALRSVRDPALATLGTFGGLTDVASGDDVLVALAECEEGGCTQVALSTDGQSWEVVPGVLADTPAGLAWSADGFVALTYTPGGRRGSAYLSADGGTWQQARLGGLGPQPVLVAGAEGYVVLACEGNGCYPELYGSRRSSVATTTVWTSIDGLDWAREAPDALQGTVLLDAAASGDALLAIGRAADGIVAGRAFVSMAGEWLPVDLPLPRVRSGETVNLVAVAALPGGGFAVTGEVLPDAAEPLGEPFVLTSPDLLAWELDEGFLETPDEDVRVYLATGAEGSDALIASPGLELDVGGDRSADGPIVAWSADGHSWSTTAFAARRGVQPYIADLAITDDGRLVVVGSEVTRRSERSAVWIGTLGPAEPEPEGDALAGKAARERPADRGDDRPVGDRLVDGSEAKAGSAASFTRAERVLLEAVVPDIAPTCVPRRTELPEGTVAALQCAPTSPVVRDMAYYLLEGDDAKAVFDERMRENRVQARSIMSCKRGTPGYEYATGALDADGCYVNSDGRANLRSISWITDCHVLRAGGVTLGEPTLYAAVLGEDDDIAALWAWAQQGIARPIKRPGAPFSPACPS